MKKIMAVLLVLAMALCLAACGEEAKGETQTIYVNTETVMTIYGQEIRYEYTYSDNGTPLSVNTYFNDTKYQTAESRTSNGVTYLTITDAEGNQQVQTTEYTYDENGNMTQISISVDGNLATYTNYSYDENGNVLTAMSVSSTRNVTTEYTYDENGNVSMEDVTISGDASDFTHTVFSYNEDNMVVLEQVYNVDGELLSYSEYAYEGDTRSVQTDYNADGTPNGTVTARVYDEHGNLTEETISIDGEVAQQTRHTYEALEVPVEDAA